MRASISRPAQTDRSLKYDYCMVFKLEGNEQTDESKFIIQKMKSKGLDVFCYLSVQKDELIALITAPVRHSLTFHSKIIYCDAVPLTIWNNVVLFYRLRS